MYFQSINVLSNQIKKQHLSEFQYFFSLFSVNLCYRLCCITNNLIQTSKNSQTSNCKLNVRRCVENVILLDLVDLISFSHLQSPHIWRDARQSGRWCDNGAVICLQWYVCSMLDDDIVLRWMCLPLIADSSLHPITDCQQ